MAFIEARDLGHRYGEKWALKRVSLSVERAEVFSLIGPTAAGKTTLLRLLDLIERPAAGRVIFDGADAGGSEKERLAARRRMSFVQQKPVLFRMSIFGNVALGLTWRGERGERIRDKVERVLEQVGLAGQGGRDARTLSGGETQRVALARALVTEPELLFLDEPTSNLDPVSVAHMERILARIIEEKRTTVVMATHDMSQGQRLAGRIGVLMDGELLQVGSPQKVFCAPGTRTVAEFVGIENILRGTIAAKEGELVTIHVNGKSVQAISNLPEGEEVDALIRPEDIIFTPVKDTTSARNVFPARISNLSEVGSLVRIEVDCGFPLLGVVTRKSAEELGFSVGKEIYANFKATAIHTIKREH
jgi:tungstate transport system ATP-binding protein